MLGKEAIILAGGLGTRLRTILPDLPKCMAPISGVPFLDILIAYLQRHGVTHFIFSLGYMSEQIMQHVNRHHSELRVSFSVEDIPLGTGGAIFTALLKAKSKQVFVCNGDTFFNADLLALEKFHLQQKADCSLALKPMMDVGRYGTVELNPDGTVRLFREKASGTTGLINGGVYLINREAFLKEPFHAKFSFEDDYLAKYLDKHTISGLVQDVYFIDIGIPKDYERAQEELRVFL